MYNNPPKAVLFLNCPLFMALPFSGCATLALDKIAIISSRALSFYLEYYLHRRENKVTPFVRKCARVFLFLEYDFMILLDCKSCVQLAERVAVTARLCARVNVRMYVLSSTATSSVLCVYVL
jgi:hypothetical protein